MFFIGNRFKKSICLFLNPIVQLLLFYLYMSVIPIKYVYTKDYQIGIFCLYDKHASLSSRDKNSLAW